VISKEKDKKLKILQNFKTFDRPDCKLFEDFLASSDKRAADRK
jgi:hypothetical protein